MSGGVVFTSFQRFMEHLLGTADAPFLNNIESAVSEIGPLIISEVCCTTVSVISNQLVAIQTNQQTGNATVSEISDQIVTLLRDTERIRQNGGGILRQFIGTTTGATTTLTPSPGPGAGESIRIRRVGLCPANPNSSAGDTEWRMDNTSAAEEFLRCEFDRTANWYWQDFGDWAAEITTASFRLRRSTGSDQVHFNIFYTIQVDEGTPL